MRGRLRWAAVFAFLAFTLPDAWAGDFVVIVNAGTAVSSINATELADFYLKKKKQWADGTAVRFVDRTLGSPERTAFLSKVVKKTPSEVELFWVGQKLYTGNSAPLKVTSDSMVVQFVSAFKGAVGFVSAAGAEGAKGVKTLKVTGLEGE